MSREMFQVRETALNTEYQSGEKLSFGVLKQIPSEVTGNYVYMGSLGDQKKLFVLKYPLTVGSGKREWQGYLIANSNQISTATPIILVAREQMPKDGLVTSFVEGTPLSKECSEKQLFELGKELRKLHRITQPGFGNIENGVAQFGSAREYLEFWFGKTLSFIENNQSAYECFKRLYDSASGRIHNLKPSFIHRDMRLENVFSDVNGVKIIDFELWQGGDPMDELAISLYDWLITNRSMDSYKILLSGYHQGEHMDDGEINSLNFHLLMRSFRFVSFCERINPKFKTEAYQNLDKVLSYLNGI